MKTPPRVSVITSCFNHEAFLDDYFDGLLRQTYANIELILFDDGSTDGSWEKIESYIPRLHDRFSRVVVERHENIGQKPQLHRALQIVEGEYVSILESDDYYYPDKVAANVELFQSHPEVGVVFSDFDRLQDGVVRKNCQQAIRNPIPQGAVLNALLQGNFIATLTSCVRTAFMHAHVDFQDFYNRGYALGDYPMWLRLARACQFGYIDRSLACYRVLKESASHSRSQSRRYQFSKSVEQVLLDFAAEFDLPAPIKDEIQRSYHYKRYYGGYAMMEESDCRQGYQWLVEHYPAEFATWKQRLRMAIVGRPRLWNVIRKIEDTRIAKKLLGEYQLPQ